MNQMPSDWSDQIQKAYPKRSGPSGWRGAKLMLALRRALFESTWEQIIDGCEKYARFCQVSGKEGSQYVQSPQRFIEDGSYLEDFEYQVAEDPKIVERRRAEQVRRAAVESEAASIGVGFDSRDSTASIETRIRFAETNPIHRTGLAESPLSGRVSALADRMRMKA